MTEPMLPLDVAPEPDPEAGSGDEPGPPRVAEVLVDVALPHLDRPFEYRLEEGQVAPVGSRVAVRFAGKEHEGFVIGLRYRAEHPGRLTTVRRVVSPEAVLTPQVLALARHLADRMAGSAADVVRLAVPRRHARAEKALDERPPEPPGPLPDAEAVAWPEYPAGESLLDRLRSGEPVRAAALALPGGGRSGHEWPDLVAEAVHATVAGGRGALVVVPDEKDVERACAALERLLGRGRHVALTAALGPQARYTAWLKVLRGHVPVVVGTRAAAYAPVRDLGLVCWWDDGDDLHREPRAPYAPVREVLAARSRLESTALLSLGHGVTSDVMAWVEAGAVPGCPPPFPLLAAGRETVRRAAPLVRLAAEGRPSADPAAAHARLADVALRGARVALEHGPVLVQVPRSGYVPALRCERCRTRARCPHCQSPMALAGPRAAPTCQWCGRTRLDYRCTECGSPRLRSVVRGSNRTAEELGRALPGTRVIASSGARVLHEVPDEPALVVATPGAEPVAPEGYAAGLLLDAWALLDLPGLDAGEEALRRWLAAAALVRPGAPVWVTGTPDDRPRPLEALVRWDPAWLARAELAERTELHLPPSARMAELRGDRAAVADALAWVSREDAAVEVLGPLEIRLPDPGPRAPSDPQVRALLRVPGEQGDRLARTVKALRRVRAAAKAPGELLARMDGAVDLR